MRRSPSMQDRHDRLRADVSDDSAHRSYPFNVLACSYVWRRAFFALDPSLDVRLPAARNAQRAGRDVLRNRRAGADVGALADADRRNQLRVAADEGAVLDDRLVLLRRRRSCT